jgi:hypothetical protein
VAEHPEDQNMRVLCQFANNLGPIAPSLLFEPVTDENGHLRIEWRGESDLTADDLLRRNNGRQDKLATAKSFLFQFLAKGPQKQQEVMRKAAEAAIAWRTVERAKELLGVKSRRKGWGPGSRCLWELHEQDHSAPHS